jgi:hypothetical protein
MINSNIKKNDDNRNKVPISNPILGILKIKIASKIINA